MSKQFDDQAQVQFIDALTKHGKASTALAVTGWDRSTIARAKKDSPYFKQQCEQALEQFKARLLMDIHDAMYSRGVKGWKEPIVDRSGQVVGYREKFSERCLIKLAERYDPEYRTNNPVVDINVNSGVLAIPKDTEKPPEDWAEQYAEFEVKPLEEDDE